MRKIYENNPEPYIHIRYVNTDKKQEILPHWQHQAEIVFVRQGTAEFYINGRTFDGKAGDVFVANIGEIHTANTYRGGITDILIIGTGVLHKFYEHPILIRNFITREMLEKKGIYNAVSDGFDIIGQNSRDSFFGNIYIQNEMIKIYTLLSQHFQAEDTVRENLPDISSDILRIYEYIDENYMNEITLSDIAGFMNYSANYTSRLFKEYSGNTFKNYLILKRIEKAAEFLRDTRNSVSDVAYMCGFNCERSFYKQFVNIMGMTPSAYRKQMC